MEEQAEIVEDNQEVEEVAVEEEVEVTYTEAEEKALGKGWKPQEEWEGSSNDFVSAGEFNRRGELLGKIVAQNKKITNLQDAVTDIKDHYGKVQETEYKRALESLKARKVEAMENDDHNVVVELDDSIDDLKRSREGVPEEVTSPGPSAEYTAWSTNNSWYNNDPMLTPIADGVAKAYMQNRPDANEEEVLDYVAKEIKTRYPEKFGVTKRKKEVASVEGGKAPVAKKSATKYTKRDLDETQREIMNSLVRAKVLTEEQYISDLAKMGELG